MSKPPQQLAKSVNADMLCSTKMSLNVQPDN